MRARCDRVVTWDRIRDVVTDEPAVRDRYGVERRARSPTCSPSSAIAATVCPGVPGWGETSAAAALRGLRHGRRDPARPHCRGRPGSGAPPGSPRRWPSSPRRDAALPRPRRTPHRSPPPPHGRATSQWRGADRTATEAICARIDDDAVVGRVELAGPRLAVTSGSSRRLVRSSPHRSREQHGDRHRTSAHAPNTARPPSDNRSITR